MRENLESRISNSIRSYAKEMTSCSFSFSFIFFLSNRFKFFHLVIKQIFRFFIVKDYLMTEPFGRNKDIRRFMAPSRHGLGMAKTRSHISWEIIAADKLISRSVVKRKA